MNQQFDQNLFLARSADSWRSRQPPSRATPRRLPQSRLPPSRKETLRTRHLDLSHLTSKQLESNANFRNLKAILEHGLSLSREGRQLDRLSDYFYFKLYSLLLGISQRDTFDQSILELIDRWAQKKTELGKISACLRTVKKEEEVPEVVLVDQPSKRQLSDQQVERLVEQYLLQNQYSHFKKLPGHTLPPRECKQARVAENFARFQSSSLAKCPKSQNSCLPGIRKEQRITRQEHQYYSVRKNGFKPSSYYRTFVNVRNPELSKTFSGPLFNSLLCNPLFNERKCRKKKHSKKKEGRKKKKGK